MKTNKIIKTALVLVLLLFNRSYLLADNTNSSSAENFSLLQDKDNFILAILPDTQKYSRYKGEIFTSQTEWISNNYEKENIVFTAHLGDLVDLADDESQWLAADKAMKILDQANLDYGVLAGNHDVLASVSGDIDVHDVFDNQRENDKEPFLKYFPAQRTADKKTYGGHSTHAWNSYYVFEANDREFLALFMDWRPSKESLAWAQSILDKHSDIPSILFTHQLMTIDEGNKKAKLSGEQGQRLWDFVKKNNQVFMTINGHHHGSAHKIAKNNFGHDVILMVVDFQSNFFGGNGMMRTLEFDLDKNKIYARSFSPWVLNIPAKNRKAQDILEKTDQDHRFIIDIDLNNRF